MDVVKLGGLCLVGGPIFFIIPFFMSHDDTTWPIALAWWTIGLISVILGIVFVISGILMKPRVDDEIEMRESKHN